MTKVGNDRLPLKHTVLHKKVVIKVQSIYIAVASNFHATHNAGHAQLKCSRCLLFKMCVRGIIHCVSLKVQ